MRKQIALLVFALGVPAPLIANVADPQFLSVTSFECEIVSPVTFNFAGEDLVLRIGEQVSFALVEPFEVTDIVGLFGVRSEMHVTSYDHEVPVIFVYDLTQFELPEVANTVLSIPQRGSENSRDEALQLPNSVNLPLNCITTGILN
jgi:hypothetical protein